MTIANGYNARDSVVVPQSERVPDRPSSGPLQPVVQAILSFFRHNVVLTAGKPAVSDVRLEGKRSDPWQPIT